MNKNFKIEYYLRDGTKEILNFEFGNTLNNYYGFMGIGLKDSNLTYRTINKQTGDTTLINYDTLKASMKPGELRFVQVDYDGRASRNVLITIDPNGRLRLIENIGGKGITNHQKLLELMGFQSEARRNINTG